MSEQAYLLECGRLDDSKIDILRAAYAFAKLDSPDLDLEKYNDLFHRMSEDLLEDFGSGIGVFEQAQSLRNIMADKYSFIGADYNYDDIRNINIGHVMDRRMGLPISLSIIAISLCRNMGWNASGINFPGHFLMSLEEQGERVIIDPYQGCKILEAKDMRLILKKMAGHQAELSADYYKPCTNREILLRLRNNLKYRLIDMSEYGKSLAVVETMTWIAPNDYRLNLDKAVLYSRLDHPKSAIDNILIYIDKVEDRDDRIEAEEFLRQLQRQLN